MIKLIQPKRLQAKAKAGFTLVELMVSTLILGLISGAIASFFIFGINFASYDTGKLIVNRDIRTFTNEMSQEATFANMFNIYSSFTTRTQVFDGLAGDFLVLVYLDPDNPDNISQVIGYYRHAAAGAEGPVYKFEQNYSPSTNAALSTLLPGTGTAGDPGHSEVVEISKGLSDGRLFYNFRDRSIMIKGEFRNQGTVERDATNTYNFTVSPRG